MSKLLVLAIALGLMLFALPFTSIGTREETATLWWLGLILLTAGGVLPPLTRFAFADGNGDDDGDGNDDES